MDGDVIGNKVGHHRCNVNGDNAAENNTMMVIIKMITSMIIKWKKKTYQNFT